MSRSVVLPVLATAVALSACVATPEPDDRVVEQLGFISVGAERARSGEYTAYGAGGLFFSVGRSLRSIETVSDGCFVEKPDGPAEPNILDQYPDTLDAGAQISLESGNQPFASLGRIGLEGGGYVYAGADLVPYPPLPDSGLTATIPGATFPAFSKALFPDVPPPVTLTGGGEGDVITSEGQFGWEPYRSSGNVSFVTFQVVPAGAAANLYTAVECVAADDGNFSFPPETKVELSQLGATFVGQVVGIERSVYRVESNGDAAVVLGLGSDPSSVVLNSE